MLPATATAFPAKPNPFASDVLCVSVIGSTPEAMQAASARLLPRFPFQEFRLDYLEGPAMALVALTEFLRTHSGLTALATCRPTSSGGRFRGEAGQELEMLLAAARAGFRLVDLSLESAEQLGPAALARLREHGAAVLISFHDFEHTGDLPAVLARMNALGPDVGKVVPTAQSLANSLTVLRFLREDARKSSFPVVALAMGEAGVPSRVLGPLCGAPFTFAAATEQEATAPGQLTAQSLAELYRIRAIGPATRIFGVAGDPIHSSLSPLMLNTAFRVADVDAVYLPLKTSDAEELFRAARELPLAGFSVTMPLKQAVMPLLDHVDAGAKAIGAVNTVRRSDHGTFHGHNSDAAGIVGPLEARRSLHGASVLVLGAGGAARATIHGCTGAGAHVSVHNRTPEKAEQLAREFGTEAVARSALRNRRFDILINATPAGMRGNTLPLPLEPDELNTGLVFDLVYNPLDTPLLQLARARGIATIPGVEMFVHQGARQFEIWTGQPAPKEVMQQAVFQALTARDA